MMIPLAGPLFLLGLLAGHCIAQGTVRAPPLHPRASALYRAAKNKPFPAILGHGKVLAPTLSTKLSPNMTLAPPGIANTTAVPSGVSNMTSAFSSPPHASTAPAPTLNPPVCWPCPCGQADCSSTSLLVPYPTKSNRHTATFGSRTGSPYTAPTSTLNSTIAANSSDALPFAGPNPNSPAFLNCYPGTFLCESQSTWAQCVSGCLPGSTCYYKTHYVNMGFVANGTQCLPRSSRLLEDGSNTHDYDPLSPGGGPAGTYRDDTIVRARPLGACGLQGSVECLRDGKGWAMCDQGGWVDMGSVAAGTVCRDGHIVGIGG